MRKSLLQVVLRQRHRNCWRFSPVTRFEIHHPSKSWSVILRARTLVASIFSTAWSTKCFPKRERFASCACGPTMSETKPNPSLHRSCARSRAARWFPTLRRAKPINVSLLSVFLLSACASIGAGSRTWTEQVVFLNGRVLIVEGSHMLGNRFDRELSAINSPLAATAYAAQTQ